MLGLDIDNAVTLRLLKFDNEKDAANKKFWIAMLGGKTDDDVLGDEIVNDPYADQNTQVW